MTDIAPLTRAEVVALDDCEQRIERGLKTFIEVGSALAAVRDNRLYRATHDTFEAYLEERWQISRSYAHRMITASEVVLPIGNTNLPMPSNEGQARELAKVPEPDRADVWAETLDRTEGRPTAAAVRESAELAEQRRKQAAEQRDARALLRRILDLLIPENADHNFVAGWSKRLGEYDEELSGLVRRAHVGISALDDLIERCGR